MTQWKKVKIGDFLTEREGRFKPDDKTIANYQRLDKIDFSGTIHLSTKPTKTDMILVHPGDLVISGINVAKGAITVYQGKEPVCATIHYSSYTFNPTLVDLDYFKYFVKSPAFVEALKQQVKGGIKTEIKPKHLLPLEISIPNLPEQKRIVSEISENFNKIEQLTDEIDLQKSYIKQLRQNILQDAIEGKLTADLPCRQAGWRKSHFKNLSGKIVPKTSDKYFAYVLECDDGSLYKGFSQNLFERINRHLEGHGAEWTQKHRPVALIHFEEFKTEKEAVEREKYFKSGSGREFVNRIRNENKLNYDAEALFEKIQEEKTDKKQKSLPAITDEEKPFDIPEGWKWVKLENVCNSITDGDHLPPPKTAQGIPFIVISDVSSGIIDFKGNRFVTNEYYKKLPFEKKPIEGDILYTVTGSYGIPILVNELKFCVQRHIGIIKPNPIIKDFAYFCLMSPIIKKQADSVAWGVAVKTIPIKELRQFLLPLPPLAEQQEIVPKTKILLNKITELESQIQERENMAKQLMQSILKDAFGEETPKRQNDALDVALDVALDGAKN